MSNFPGVRQALDWVRELERAAREFDERERRRDEEHRAGLQRENVAFRQAVEAAGERRAQALRDEEEFGRARTADARRRHERRASSLLQAALTSRQQRARRIEAEEDDTRHRIQIRKQELDASRQAELAQVDAAHEAFTADLGRRYRDTSALTERIRHALRGYRGRLAQTWKPAGLAGPDLPEPAGRLLPQIDARMGQAADGLGKVESAWLPRLFRRAPPGAAAVLIVALHAAAAAGLHAAGRPSLWVAGAAASAAVTLLLAAGLHRLGWRRIEPAVRRICDDMAAAAKLHDVCTEKAAMQRHVDRQQIERNYAELDEQLEREWKLAAEKAESARLLGPLALKEKAERVRVRNDRLLQQVLRRIEAARPRRLAALEDAARREMDALAAAHETALAALDKAWRTDREGLAAGRKRAMAPVREAVAAANADTRARFPDWSDPGWERWTPPAAFAQAAPFAALRLPDLSVPLLLTFPEQGSILFETRGPARDRVAPAMNHLMMRLLTSTPPGKLSFTIVDPVELGQNFAGIMHLADYEEGLVNGRIWTQPSQIERQLAEITDHMEKVIQTYLRNEYATIAEYNEQAGEIAEKYRFLVVSDFPAGFSDLAIDRLLGIVASGSRCGVYTILHWDLRQRVPRDSLLEDLRRTCISVRSSDGPFRLHGAPETGVELALDAPPDARTSNRLLHEVGRASIDSTRVEVPFAHVAPADGECWTRDTTAGIKVAVGRTGATKLQFLELGQDTRQHALIVGKTGSGKSTLFHVMITNLALWCGPDQVEFYLVDFKKGVEFKCYAVHRLPHARVVAIESDREFGLSVLQRVDEELMRRGERFRELGVQDLRGYKKAGGTERVPRTLLIVDEFQEFFVQDDAIAQHAALLLDRLVRQGRAFGIHVLLGSQTLGGTYTLARTTLGQMVVRIALQCNEADALLVMDEGNAAARLLTRPGEAIYNDAAGLLEGNSPFQVVWLPDDERDRRLAQIRHIADRAERPAAGPIVFEGNAPASIDENLPLRALLEAPAPAAPAPARVWLGSPNSIKGPTEAAFRRQGGAHLLIVGQREEMALTALAVALLTLSAQHRPGGARFVLLDATAPESPQRAFLDAVAAAVPHELIRARPSTMDDALGGLAGELDRREASDGDGDAPAVYLLIDGLQRFKRLRFEEDFSFGGGDDGKPEANPSAILDRLAREGSAVGLHVLASCDTGASAARFLSRKALDGFSMRVLFQMSANDSASLVDSAAASNLGLHRALFCDIREGHVETFRPYARPGRDWIERTAAGLARLQRGAGA